MCRRSSFLVLAIFLSGPARAQDACAVADILFGEIAFDIIPYDGYETAIVRSATFEDPEKNYGAILGEITVDRGGYSVRTPNQVVVGFVTEDYGIESTDEACSMDARFVEAEKGVWVIMNRGRPMGTLQGRWPK